MTDSSRRISTTVVAVMAGYLVVNLAMLAATGVRVGGDTPIYIDGARGLLAGEALTARQPSYLGYILVVAVASWTGAGLAGVALLQVLGGAAAAGVVVVMSRALGGASAGWIAAALVALDVDSNRWHAYILSDSLYASTLAIATWLVHRASRTGGGAHRTGALAGLGAAALLRPEGWFVLPAAAIWWVWRGARSSARRWLALGGVAVGAVLVVALVAPRLSGNVQAVGPGEMLRQGQTIWDYDGWRLPMPPAPPDDKAYGSAGAAVRYAVRHPVATAELMLARVVVHVAHVRPFYSIGHNVLVAAWFVPVYAFGIAGWRRLQSQPLVRWLLVIIGTQTLVVALTHADYDGRYLAHVMPLWYPLAACGIAAALARVRPSMAGTPSRA